MDERVNIDEEHRFVHWAEDPAGQLFCVQGRRPSASVGRCRWRLLGEGHVSDDY